jgi:molybdopterin synthase sulfur carrier subunit
MATVTIRYWAAAKEAAGTAEEIVEAATLAGALDAIVASRPDRDRLPTVLSRSSFLVDGVSVGRSMVADQVLHDGTEIEVLPAFAGGLAGLLAGLPGGLGNARLLRHTVVVMSECIRACT